MQGARSTGDATPLDATHAAFVQGGVSVVIASSGAGLVPDVVRGCGCRVSADRRRVTVLLDGDRADRLLADIRDNGRIAVVFSRPSTHETIQLKGSDARVAKTTTRDRALAAAHRERWVRDLCRIGYTGEFAQAVWGPLPQSLVALTFTAAAAYQQTPGPAAGQPLPGR
jgi:hypothetical protein